MTLLSFVAALVVALGAGGAWLAGAPDLASSLAVITAILFAVALTVTIATRITMSVLAARDPQLKSAMNHFEREALLRRAPTGRALPRP